jgi:hypothetical protein
MITTAQYTTADGALIACTIDDQVHFLPADADGEMGRMLAAYLEAGGTIAPYEAPPDPVPPVSAAQAVVALDHVHLLDLVEAAVARYPRNVQLWYQRAQMWERYNPYVMGLGLELGLDDAQIDNLFRYAATLDR